MGLFLFTSWPQLLGSFSCLDFLLPLFTGVFRGELCPSCFLFVSFGIISSFDHFHVKNIDIYAIKN